MRDGGGRFLAQKNEALALADKHLGGVKRKSKRRKRSSLMDTFDNALGYITGRSGTGTRRRSNSASRRKIYDEARSRAQRGGADTRSGGETFGENIAYNVGSVMNGVAARDIGIAVAGSVMYLLVPPALNIITGRRFDHNGAGGVLSGLGASILIGMLTGSVPFIAGSFAAFAAQAAYVLFDKQVLENVTSVRLAKWNPKSDTTMGGLADGGIYDNQPYPRQMVIDGENVLVYRADDIHGQLENGQKLKEMAQAEESINHLADESLGRLGDVLSDVAGNHWLPLGDGRYLQTDEEGEAVMAGNNFIVRDGNSIYEADAELERIDAQVPQTTQTQVQTAHTTENVNDNIYTQQRSPLPKKRAPATRTGHRARARF